MGNLWQAALGPLLLLTVAAVDDQQPFVTPGSAQDLENQREAARERTRSLAQEEGALISPDRGRQDEPARPTASMQDRFSSAWQRAVAGLQQRRPQAAGNAGGPQQQGSDGAGPSNMAGQQQPPPVQAGAQAGAQAAGIRPPGYFMRLLLSQGSQGSQPATSQPPVSQPAPAVPAGVPATSQHSSDDGWRNLDMSAAYNAAYAQGIADRMRQQQQQQQQQQQLFQQLYLQQQQQLHAFLGQGVTPAPRPAAASGPGAFAGLGTLMSVLPHVLFGMATNLQPVAMGLMVNQLCNPVVGDDGNHPTYNPYIPFRVAPPIPVPNGTPALVSSLAAHMALRAAERAALAQAAQLAQQLRAQVQRAQQQQPPPAGQQQPPPAGQQQPPPAGQQQPPPAQPAPPAQPVQRGQQPDVLNNPLYKAALDPNATPAYHDIGQRTSACAACGAKLWPQEVKRDGTGGMLCCMHGKARSVSSLFPHPAPEPLRRLLTADPSIDQEARQFQANVRKYNSLLQMASSGIKIASPQRGISMLAITGGIYHMLPTLQPNPLEPAKYAQLYIIDNEDLQVARRLEALNLQPGANAGGVNDNTLRSLQQMLHNNNQYVRRFRQVMQMDPNGLPQYDLVITVDGTPDLRRYNAPTANEVAGVMPGDGSEPTLGRNIKVHTTAGNPQFISELNAACDPLHFPLLHPRGEPGYHKRIQAAPRVDGRSGGRQQFLTPREYAAFFVHDRQVADNFLMVCANRLFQEWLVDMYCRIESDKLFYIRTHQNELRADVYRGLADALNAGDTAVHSMGRCVIMPSSFVGGPRHMAQCYQDAMAIVRDLGKPSLFITCTCNPNWPEILRELRPGQRPNDRPDIINRVFRLKLDELLNDIRKKGVFGRVVGEIYVIEFQKRGLPHAHILIILHHDDKLRTVADFDLAVSAQLPDPAQEPELYQTVTSCMLHGPCGMLGPNAPCMVDGKCSKNFPKQFQEETVDNGESYPVYCRPDNGITYITRSGVTVDNRWVVPYNRWLLYKFQAHINVEVCATVQAVKYLYKYVYKGHDCARVRVVPADAAAPTAAPAAAAAGQQQDRDELKAFVDGRYVSASEAHWRIMAFDMHEELPNVVRLAVHLPGQQTVMFRGDSIDNAHAALERSGTTLTAWFAFNEAAKDKYEADCALVQPPFALPPEPECLSTLYHDFPKLAVYNKKDRVWTDRQRVANSRGLQPIGRMYSAHPNDQERFHLRLLLCHVPGATSYGDLKTYNGLGYLTFRDACVARGLLEDDREWDLCIAEAASFRHPSSLREMFAALLRHNSLQQPVLLWEKYKLDFCEDILHRERSVNPARQLDAQVWDQALLDIEIRLLQMGGERLPSYGMPTYAPTTARNSPGLLAEERARYPPAEQAGIRDQSVPQLNTQQRAVYDAVLGAVEGNNNGTAFFVDGLGGAGKTFLYSCLLSSVRADGKVAIPVASSGIAALLLQGGRTAHSRFKVPMQGLDGNSTCNIAARSDVAAFIQAADLIVWDEAPMMHKHVFEAVDRTLRDIMGAVDPANRDKLFGGKVIVLGGDFRQILPVIKKGSRGDIVAASLNQSARLWPHVQVFKLHENMRVARLQLAGDVNSAREQQEFANYLKGLGEGTETVYQSAGEDFVRIPDHMCCSGGANATITDLINDVYGDLSSMHNFTARSDFIVERAILTPLNEDVDQINKKVMSMFATTNPDGTPVASRVYKSFDSLEAEEQRGFFPLEFLNSLNFAGMPPHELHVKVGCPIILMRNLSNGLANGTRMIVTGLSDRVIQAKIATGPEKGRIALIPRITLTSDDGDMPFKLKRKQFPVRPAFAMTINKSQGQTMKSVGVYLPKSVFTHGQLYVAFSRVGSPAVVKVLVVNGWRPAQDGAPAGVYTKNVVYREVFH